MTSFSSFLLDSTFVGCFSQEFEESFNTVKERSLQASEKRGHPGCLPNPPKCYEEAKMGPFAAESVTEALLRRVGGLGDKSVF